MKIRYSACKLVQLVKVSVEAGLVDFLNEVGFCVKVSRPKKPVNAFNVSLLEHGDFLVQTIHPNFDRVSLKRF